jgi:hypothetical protein
MTDFVKLPIEATPQQLLEETVAEMEAQLPNWDANLGEYEMILFQAIVFRIAMPFLQLASQVDSAIFFEWGAQIVNVQPHEATKATVTSTWKVKNGAGYTIRAGTQVDIARSGDERLGFIVVSDVEVPEGSEETAAGEVLLEAVEAGLEYEGLEGEGILVDALDWVLPKGIAIVGASSGGSDAEEPDHYLGRLAETMQTFIEGVVIGRDVEIVARNVAGVGRALAIDNFNLLTEEDEQEKTTTVILTDSEGEPVAAGVKEAVEAKLEESREVNYIFTLGSATYNEIDVEAVIVPMQGFDQATVAAQVKVAIEDFLAPTTFGQQPPGDASSWVNSTTLRYQDLTTVVNNTEGVDYASTLKWRKAAEAFAAADIKLTGVAPLPRADAITVT